MGAVAGPAVQAGLDVGAANAAQTGFNYAKSSPLATTYGPNGVSANNILSQLLGASPNGTGGVSGTAAYNNAPTTQALNQIGKTAIGPTNTAGTATGGGVIGLPGVGGGAAAGNEANNFISGLTNQSYFPNYLSAQQNLANAGTNAYSTITNATNPAAASNAMLQAGNAAGQAVGGAYQNYFAPTATYAPSQVSSMGAIASMDSSDAAGQQAGAGGGFF